MSNKLVQATTPKNNKAILVAFEKFYSAHLATISDSDGRKTHAFGETKCKAQENAIRNFNLKYNTAYFTNSF